MKRMATALLATVVGAGLVSSAYAADLIIDEPAPVGIVEVSGNWDGPFVGVFAGYGWGTLDDSEEDGIGLTSADATLDLTGWLLGVNAGANFTLTDGIVAGVVADVAWSNITGTDTLPAPDFTFDVDWVASARGVLGFDGGAFMPYLTAGVAVAGATATSTTSDSQTHFGWTAGAGVKFAAAENIDIDLLYRFSDYGSQDYALGGAPGIEPLSFTTHTVQLGVNFSF